MTASRSVPSSADLAATRVNELTMRNPECAVGESDYFTAHERERLKHWSTVVADMPPMTQDEIERVAEVFRQIDASRNATP